MRVLGARAIKALGRLASNNWRKWVRRLSRPMSGQRPGQSLNEVERHLSAAFDCLCQAIETYRDKKKGR